MTENEIREYISILRCKANAFRESSSLFANEAAIEFDRSADVIEETSYLAIKTLEELNTYKFMVDTYEKMVEDLLANLKWYVDREKSRN